MRRATAQARGEAGAGRPGDSAGAGNAPDGWGLSLHNACHREPPLCALRSWGGRSRAPMPPPSQGLLCSRACCVHVLSLPSSLAPSFGQCLRHMDPSPALGARTINSQYKVKRNEHSKTKIVSWVRKIFAFPCILCELSEGVGSRPGSGCVNWVLQPECGVGPASPTRGQGRGQGTSGPW